jgi:1-acyl-sn-glycerol-3-phosphate acyltransferase
MGVQQIAASLQEGESVVIFPEATFTRAIGIRPFKLGAFKVAVEGNIPICPIAICGTRHILPGDRWTMRRGKVDIIITEPMYPKSDNFAEIKRLRDETRIRIIELTKEPALDLIAAGPEQ